MSDALSAWPNRIETERLMLRRPVRGDAAALVEIGNNPRIAVMLERLPSPYTRADALGFIEITARRDSEEAYVIEDRRRTLVGIASITRQPGAEPELGYWLGERFWGRGYATEAVTALLATAQAAALYSVLRARILLHNYASARVLGKCGFLRTHSSVAATGVHAGKSVVHFEVRLS